MACSFKCGVVGLHSFVIQKKWEPLSCLLDVYEQYIEIFSPTVISLILIHYQSNYLFADMWVCRFCFILSWAAWLSPPLLSPCAPPDDKTAALSQAIAYEAKGHLRNDRGNMTLAALASAISFSFVENCWQLINRWISSMGYCHMFLFSYSAALSDWVELRRC